MQHNTGPYLQGRSRPAAAEARGMKHASSCSQESPLVYQSRPLMASTTLLATSQASARLSSAEVADRTLMLSPWNTSCKNSAFT